MATKNGKGALPPGVRRRVPGSPVDNPFLPRGGDGFNITRRTDPSTIDGQPPAQDAQQQALDGALSLLARLAKWIPPRGALSRLLQGEADVNAIGITNFGSTFTVPASHQAVLNFFQGMSTVVDATFAGSFFSVNRNGAAIPGLEGVTIFQAGGAQANAPGDVFVELEENELVSVAFSHAQASARHVGFQARVYYWPKGAELGR